MSVQNKYNMRPQRNYLGGVEEVNPYDTATFTLQSEFDKLDPRKANEAHFGSFVQQGDGDDVRVASMIKNSTEKVRILGAITHRIDNLSFANKDRMDVNPHTYIVPNGTTLAIMRQGYMYVNCESHSWKYGDPVYLRMNLNEIFTEGYNGLPGCVSVTGSPVDIGDFVDQPAFDADYALLPNAHFADNSDIIEQKNEAKNRIAKIYFDFRFPCFVKLGGHDD